MEILEHIIDTKEGNFIKVFYNKETNLLVIDLVDKSETGGIELFREFLHEKDLLNHLKINNTQTTNEPPTT